MKNLPPSVLSLHGVPVTRLSTGLLRLSKENCNEIKKQPTKGCFYYCTFRKLFYRFSYCFTICCREFLTVLITYFFIISIFGLSVFFFMIADSLCQRIVFLQEVNIPFAFFPSEENS